MYSWITGERRKKWQIGILTKWRYFTLWYSLRRFYSRHYSSPPLQPHGFYYTELLLRHIKVHVTYVSRRPAQNDVTGYFPSVTSRRQRRNYIATKRNNLRQIFCSPHFQISLSSTWAGHQFRGKKINPDECVEQWWSCQYSAWRIITRKHTQAIIQGTNLTAGVRGKHRCLAESHQMLNGRGRRARRIILYKLV